MTAKSLTEISTNLIMNHLKSNLPAAIAEVIGARASEGILQGVNVSVPREWFFYEPARAYQAPAVFVICTDMDFNKEQSGANFISGLMAFSVSAVVEAQREDQATLYCWRYQAAIEQVLDQAILTDDTANVRIELIARNLEFSPVLTTIESKPSSFRKEVGFTFEVRHLES